MSQYLEIKNWEKYQTAKKNCTWVKDYVEKDFDPDISKLTVFQRGILDMCCRLRGRQGRNLRNDPLWIVSAVSIMSHERHNAVSAVSLLIARGFLIPTDQQDSFKKTPRLEEKRVDKEKIKPSRRCAPGPNPAKVTNALADHRHQRIQEMVMTAYREQNGVECPWDGSEGKNLQALLKSTPRWTDSQITQCLGNLYASAGFAKGTRPREWLTKLPKYLSGPLNEFNGEKTKTVSKSQERHERNNEKYRDVISSISARPGRNLPLGNDESGTGDVSRLTEQISPNGSHGGGRRIDAEPAGRVDGPAKVAGLSADDPREKGAPGRGNQDTGRQESS